MIRFALEPHDKTLPDRYRFENERPIEKFKNPLAE
jgi:hypothetical protein